MVHVQCNSEATLTGDSSFLNGYIYAMSMGTALRALTLATGNDAVS